MTEVQPYDLRGWLDAVDGVGELLRVSGASWDAEMAVVVFLPETCSTPRSRPRKNLEMIGADSNGYVFCNTNRG